MKRTKKFFADFKKFISRGNIIDMAVGVIIGSAFGKIVSSLVNDVIMPLICSIFNSKDVAELCFNVNKTPIYYGKFIQAIIDFLIIAFFVFLMIKMLAGFSDSMKSLKKAGKHELSREERKKLRLEGMTRKQIAQKEAELRAEREAREKQAAEDAQKAKEQNSTEGLLKQIRDLLQEQQGSKKEDKK